MSVPDLLGRLVAALSDAAIPYMVTGSYASSLHSVPRATRDIDIVIFPNREQLTRFIQRLPSSSYHADLEDAVDALRRRSQFNVVDYATGWKIDFIIPPFDEFHVEEFERRQSIGYEGLQLSVVSPEDIVVAKLLWAKKSGSERQIADVVAVLRSQGSGLVISYVEKWVRKLGLEEQWRRARAEPI
ncbi:MAG: hypothetical protein JWO56_1012 [Acidobacteria bacterium]|nr:hypothetical protein [Acidobacteriota bacterium]